MKKYQRYILGSLALLSVIALIVFIKSNKKVEDRKKTEIKTIMIDNMFATYEHINRELTMDYFYALDDGEYDKLLRMCQYTNEKNIKDIPLKNAD